MHNFSLLDELGEKQEISRFYPALIVWLRHFG